LSVLEAGADPGFGVYVHWPFCASKCPYCDFNSHVRSGGVDEGRYLGAYLREIDHVAGLVPGRTVGSIFFGGGTPSLMAPATVAAILERIGAHWTVAGEAEITLEANPSSVEAERFAGYRAAGVNRVSLGVQSLREADLRALGRLHGVAEAKAAVAIAQRTFERSSFDLIYARPGQSANDWRVELAEALALAGGHLSLYQLTIEPETPFAALHKAGRLKTPPDEAAHGLYEITQEMTGAAGLDAYEVSNHARAGEESRHNLLYWRYGEYAGIGAGAHGRLVIDGARTALSTERNPERWAALVDASGTGVTMRETLAPAEVADEMLIMGLRIREGVDLARLAGLTGRRPNARVLDDLEALGLAKAEKSGQRIAATAQGRFLLNEVVRRLSQGLEPVAPTLMLS
jgi:putative oxygen-independent coproporphyrinogen III oxidase